MPDAPNIDWFTGAKPAATSTPPPPSAPPVAKPVAAASSGPNIDWFTQAKPDKAEPTPPPEQGASTPGLGSLLTKSVFTMGSDKSLSDLYNGSQLQKTLDGIIPESVRGTGTGVYTSKFLAELSRQGAGFLDAVTSLGGIGLIAMHMIPQARGVAAVADYAMAAQQGAALTRDMAAFMKDPSDPEKAARAAAGLFTTYGLVKAGGRTAKAASEANAGASPPPFQDSGAVVEKISTAGGPVEKVEALNASAGAPTTKKTLGIPGSNKIAAALHANPLTSQIAKVLNIPKSELLTTMSDLAVDNSAAVGTAQLHTNVMLDQLAQSVPAEERQVYTTDPAGKLVPTNGMVAVHEGTAPASSISAAGQQAVEALRKATAERDKFAQAFYGRDAQGFLDDYVWHAWEDPDTPAARAGKAMMTDRYLNNTRIIPTYAEGIALGMKPKFNDALDLYKIRDDSVHRAIANQRTSNILSDIGSVVTDDVARKLGLKSQGWVKLDDVPALSRAVYTNAESKLGVTRGETPILKVTQTKTYQPVWAHPDAAELARTLWSKGFDGPAFRKIDLLRATGKKYAFAGSFFHPVVLSEATVANDISYGGAVDLNKIKKWYSPEAFKAVEEAAPGGQLPNRVGRGAGNLVFAANKEYRAGMKAGYFDVVGKRGGDRPPILRPDNEGIAADALKAGLKLGSLDAEAGVTKWLQTFGKDSNPAVRVVTQPLRMMGNASHIADSALWSFYHPAMKLHSYLVATASELSKMPEDATAAQIAGMKRAVASHINNAFGDVNYEQMLIHPKTRQVLNYALFAPSWTIANSKLWTQAFDGAAATKLSAKYALGAFVPWFLTTNLANYALTSYYGMPDKDGKKGGHFALDNPGVPIKIGGVDTGVTSNWTNIADGMNENGSQRFIVVGKGLREGFNWLTDPTKTFIGKLSPVVTAPYELVTGIDPSSGYKVIDEFGTPSEKAVEAADIVVQSFLPMLGAEKYKELKHKLFPELFAEPGSGGQSLFSFPTVQGYSMTRALQDFTKAMNADDGEAAAAVLKYAGENNLKVGSIVDSYKSRQRLQTRRAAGLQGKVNPDGSPQE